MLICAADPLDRWPTNEQRNAIYLVLLSCSRCSPLHSFKQNNMCCTASTIWTTGRKSSEQATASVVIEIGKLQYATFDCAVTDSPPSSRVCAQHWSSALDVGRRHVIFVVYVVLAAASDAPCRTPTILDKGAVSEKTLSATMGENDGRT